MRDLETPPFIVGDNAYLAPAPGGFANAGAVPDTYPADVAYTAPSLGGEFQPGDSELITTKGAPADGGQALLEALHNAPPVVPPPETIVANVAIAADGKSATVALTGGPTAPADQTLEVHLTIAGQDPETEEAHIPAGTSLAAASAMLRQTIGVLAFVTTEAIAGSAQITVLAEPGHTIEVLTVGPEVPSP